MSIDVSTLAVEVKSSGISDTATGLNKIFLEAGKAERRVTTLTASVARLSQMFTQGSATAQAYQAAVANANRSVGGHDAATSALTIAMKALTGAMATLTATVDKLDTATVRNTKSMRAHTNGMADAHAMARGLSGSLGALWVTYGNLVPLAAGLAIGASFKSIISTGAQVENTLEGIRVKGEETFASISAMRDAIGSLGQGVYGPLEVAKAFETLILAGLSAKQALVGIKDAMNLAIVGGTSIEKASFTLVQVATSIGFTAEGFGRVGDVIAKTAAVSMSSVESLSESFRAASSVNKLYGVSLVDIGTGLAALSQLGIQGSAAGTSLKNFYKGLATETDKLKNVLASMKMTPADLKDANGDFLDMVTVVGKLSAGLDKLSPAQQKLATNMLANERGLKTLVEVMDLYRQKTADGTNELETFRDKISDSYAFAALGAAQLALTAENQFKSVKNTLSTSFVDAFKSIQPQLVLFSSRLREIFNSDEFKTAITTTAIALAELGVAIANNIGPIIGFVAAIASFKTVMFVTAGLQAMAGMIATVATAFEAGRIGALAFEASLGILGAILAVAGAAWAYYYSQKNRGADTKEAAALSNLDEYVKKLNEETDRMEKVNAQMIQGKTLREAETAATEEGAMALARLNAQKYIENAQAKVAAAQKNYNEATPGRFSILGNDSFSRVKAQNELDAAQAGLTEAQAKANGMLASAEIAIARARAAARTQAAVQEAMSASARDLARQNAGNGTLPDKAATTQGKTLANEIAGLHELTAQYKAKTDALAQSGATELAVAAGVHEARVQAEIDEGKYSKVNADRLLAAAREADVAKFSLDGEKAAHDMSDKLTKKLAVENEALSEVNQGRTKLIGVTEASVIAEQKYWNTDPNGAVAQRNLKDARTLDELTAAKERALKFNRGTEELNKEAQSLFQQGDAMAAFGRAGKQSAIQLAELVITQQKLDPVTQSNIINQRLAAAGMVDLGNSYVQLLKTSNLLGEANVKSEEDQIASVLSSESAKVMAKRDATLKSIQFDMQRAEAAKTIAESEGLYGEEQIAAYNKVKAALSAAMGALDKNTADGLLVARSKELSNMVEQSKELGTTLESVFGGAGKAIGDMTTGMIELRQSQEAYNDSIKLASELRAKGDNVRAIQVEEEATKKSSVAQMKSYADILGASKNFFKEGTTGYKVMHAAETAFRVAELAMAYQNMIQKLFFTQTTTAATVTGYAASGTAAVASAAVEVPANMAKAQSSALAAVANQGQGDPYSAFVRIAIMAAIMAGLGLLMGGAGGGGGSQPPTLTQQQQQGTGTVLGDETAKSESIGKSLDLLASNSVIALEQSSNMLEALRSIRDGIAGMATFVARTTGLRGTTADQAALGVGSSKGFLGFSSSSTELTDSGITVNPGQTVGSARSTGIDAQGYADVHKQSSSFFGLSKSSSDQEILSGLDQSLKNQMALTIGSLYDGVLSAAKVFGQKGSTLEAALNNISLADAGLSKISLKGLSGDDLQKELEAVFSAVGDKMAQVAMPGLDQFQKVGEGYFQTLVRVANGIDVADASLEQLGVTAISYTDILNKQGDVATEIVRDSLMAKETIGGALDGIGQVIETLDGSASDIIDVYKQLANARDMFNANGLNGNNISRDTIRGAGGLDQLTTGVKDYFSNFYTEAEQQASTMKLLNGQFADLGLSMPGTKDAFKAMVKAADDGTESGDRLVGKLLTLSAAFSDAADKADELRMKAVDSAFSALQRSVNAQKQAATDAYNAEVTRIKNQAETDTAAAKLLLTPAQDALKAVQTIFDAIGNALKSTAVDSAALSAQRRREAQDTLRGALAFSNGGGSLASVSGLSTALDNIAKPSEDLFTSFQDYARDQAQTAMVLQGLQDNSKQQVDTAQLTIDGINGTIDAIKTTSDAALAALDASHTADLARLDKIVSDAQLQIDALNGVDNSVLSLADAIGSFQLAVTAALAGRDTAADIANAVLSVQQAQTQAAATAAAAAAANTSSIAQPFIDNMAKAASVITPQAVASNMPPEGSPSWQMADIAFIEGRTPYGPNDPRSYQSNGMPISIGDTVDGGFAVGTNYLPNDMTARVHEGERIVPKADNLELMRRLKEPSDARASREELAAAIADLKQAVMSGDIANVQQTRELVKLIRKFDGEGMPPVRDTTV